MFWRKAPSLPRRRGRPLVFGLDAVLVACRAVAWVGNFALVVIEVLGVSFS